jgi:hypothetical protein
MEMHTAAIAHGGKAAFSLKAFLKEINALNGNGEANRAD